MEADNGPMSAITMNAHGVANADLYYLMVFLVLGFSLSTLNAVFYTVMLLVPFHSRSSRYSQKMISQFYLRVMALID